MKGLFWIRVVILVPVFLTLAFVTVPLFVFPPAAIFANTWILRRFARYYRRMELASIWFIPLSQALLCAIACVIAYRSPSSGGILVFPPWFETVILILWGLTWIVPSAVIACMYPSMQVKQNEAEK